MGVYKKMKVYFPMFEEVNVREAFAKFHELLGYPKIIKSRDRSSDETGSATPDYLCEDADGKTYRTEVKVFSSYAKGYEDQIDLVICWFHDWTECPIKVLDLDEHIDDPHSFFKNLEIDITKFVKNKDPSIEVTERKEEYYNKSYFILSKKYNEQENFVRIKYWISDGLAYYVCELNVPEILLQKFDKTWNLVLEDLLEPLQAETFTVNTRTRGVGTMKTIKEIIISKHYMAKDLMDNPETAKARLSSDVSAIFNYY